MVIGIQVFFQNLATSRRRRNLIKSLIDDNGVKHEDASGMKDLVQSYFTNLFTSEVNHLGPEVLSDVGRRVSDEMNNELMAPFTREEVKAGLMGSMQFSLNGFGICWVKIWRRRFWTLLILLVFRKGGMKPQ